MSKHYNVTTEKMPCVIVMDEKRYIYSVEHTVAWQERKLDEINKKWVMKEESIYTDVAETDGGCDRFYTETYYHEMKMENAIFDEEEIIGFYYDYGKWNGSNDKPNAHIFLMESPDTLKFYTHPYKWELIKKVE